MPRYAYKPSVAYPSRLLAADTRPIENDKTHKLALVRLEFEIFQLFQRDRELRSTAQIACRDLLVHPDTAGDNGVVFFAQRLGVRDPRKPEAWARRAAEGAWVEIIFGELDNIMPTRNLDRENLENDDDWEGNNAAFRCPQCGKVFIVSDNPVVPTSHDERGVRRCPACGLSTARISGGKGSGGSASIESKKEQDTRYLLGPPEVEEAAALAGRAAGTLQRVLLPDDRFQTQLHPTIGQKRAIQYATHVQVFVINFQLLPRHAIDALNLSPLVERGDRAVQRRVETRKTGRRWLGRDASRGAGGLEPRRQGVPGLR